jgi:hypothetical protein
LQKIELIEHFAIGATTISWLGKCFVFLSIPVFFVFLSQKNKNTRAIASEKCEQFFKKNIICVIICVFNI